MKLLFLALLFLAIHSINFGQVNSIHSIRRLRWTPFKLCTRRQSRRIDSETNNVNKKIDILQRLNLATHRYKRKLERLDEVRQKTEAQFTKKLNVLKSKTSDKLTSLDLPPEYKEPLNELTNKINQLDINSREIGLDELNIPGYSPPSEAISSLTDKTINLTNMAEINLPHKQILLNILPGFKVSAYID